MRFFTLKVYVYALRNNPRPLRGLPQPFPSFGHQTAPLSKNRGALYMVGKIVSPPPINGIYPLKLYVEHGGLGYS